MKSSNSLRAVVVGVLAVGALALGASSASAYVPAAWNVTGAATFSGDLTFTVAGGAGAGSYRCNVIALSGQTSQVPSGAKFLGSAPGSPPNYCARIGGGGQMDVGLTLNQVGQKDGAAFSMDSKLYGVFIWPYGFGMVNEAAAIPFRADWVNGVPSAVLPSVQTFDNELIAGPPAAQQQIRVSGTLRSTTRSLF